MRTDMVAVFIFLLIAGIACLIFVVTYGRNFIIEKKLMDIFGKVKCKIFDPEVDKAILSPVLKKDCGDILTMVSCPTGDDILYYTVGVTGQLSELKYFIVVKDYPSIENQLIGIEYIYRVAKSNKLYEKILFGLNNLPADLDVIDQYVEAVELYNNKAYVFYRLPILWGSQPLKQIIEKYNTKN